MSNLHYGNRDTLLQIRKYQILHCRTQDASRKQTTAQELHSRKFISFQTQQTRRTKTVGTSKVTTTILTDDNQQTKQPERN